MRSFFEIVKSPFMRASFFAFLFSVLIGSYAALAGVMPPDEGQESNIEEPSAQEPAVEVPVVEDVPENGSGRFTVGARGYLFLISDSDFSSESSDYGPLSGTANGNGGYNFSLLLGYDFGNGLRLEAEAGYIHSCLREMDVKEPGSLVRDVGLAGLSDSSPRPCLVGSSEGCVPYDMLPDIAKAGIKEGAKGEKDIEGGVSAFAFMINAYYDLNPDGRLVPYVGAGLGVLNLSVDVKSDEGVTDGEGLLDDSDSTFAYQVGAGLGYKVDGDGDVTLSVDYRYLASFEDPEFVGEISGDIVEAGFAGHYVGGGIRLAF